MCAGKVFIFLFWCDDGKRWTRESIAKKKKYEEIKKLLNGQQWRTRYYVVEKTVQSIEIIPLFLTGA